MKCLVCGNDSFKDLYGGLLRKCTQCTFITANYDMERFNAAEIYDENYFTGDEYENYLRDKDTFLYNYNKRIDFLVKKDGHRAFRDVLELGCAYGFFGLALQKKFPESSYTGIDITPVPIEYGKTNLGLNLICEDYLSFPAPGKYSDIFMWDVIEHLPPADVFVDKIYHDLKPGGRLYLTTGDISALLPRLQGRKWRMIHPPSHLHYFSRQTMKLLLEQKGFRVISITYPPVNRSLKQIYYSLFLLNKKKGGRLHKRIHAAIPEGVNIPLNTFDIMMVVAEKPQ